MSILLQKDTVLISHADNHIMMELCSTPIVFEDVQFYSQSDPVISRVIDFLITGECSYVNENESEMNRK